MTSLTKSVSDLFAPKPKLVWCSFELTYPNWLPDSNQPSTLGLASRARGNKGRRLLIVILDGHQSRTALSGRPLSHE